MDCGRDTGRMREHYYIHDLVWHSVVDTPLGMLCVGCLEIRLGRRLDLYDFTSAYINDRANEMSDRLRSRLTPA